jgi:hypothetical protein
MAVFAVPATGPAGLVGGALSILESLSDMHWQHG